MASIYAALAACGGMMEPRVPTPIDQTEIAVCEDMQSFRATLAGADTIAFLGCAAYVVNPDGWTLKLYDGPHTAPRYTLELRRGERPLEGVHAVGDQTGISNPRFTASLHGATRVFQAVDGTVQIIASAVGNVHGALDLAVVQSSGARYTLTGAFEANCSQRPTLGC
jgi:hypothetical protein